MKGMLETEKKIKNKTKEKPGTLPCSLATKRKPQKGNVVPSANTHRCVFQRTLLSAENLSDWFGNLAGVCIHEENRMGTCTHSWNRTTRGMVSNGTWGPAESENLR